MKKTALVIAVLTALMAVPVIRAASTPEDEARLKQTGNCPGCNLAGADLQGLVALVGDLSNADFTEANLYRAVLEGANLTGANFNGADLTGAQLKNAKGADLTGALTDWRTTCPNGEAGPCK